jgi:hypothetical protein
MPNKKKKGTWAGVCLLPFLKQVLQYIIIAVIIVDQITHSYALWYAMIAGSRGLWQRERERDGRDGPGDGQPASALLSAFG